MTDLNGLKELKDWLRNHREQFSKEDYTVEDIAALAIACGFSRIAVANWESGAKFREIPR